MKKPTLWGLMLLVVAVFTLIESWLLLGWQIGTLDPRCMLLRGYVIAHTFRSNGWEVIRCERETP